MSIWEWGRQPNITMKRANWLTLLLAVFAATLVFSSCSSDNEKDEPIIPEEEITEGDFVGSWKEETTGKDALYIVLEAGGSGTYIDVYGSDIDNAPLTWRYRNKQITFTVDGEITVWNVVSVSNSKMVLSGEEGQITFKRVKASDIPEPDDPVQPSIAVAGKWSGDVYQKGEATGDPVSVELGNDMTYKEYNSRGQLIGSGKYTYSGNTITIPSGYISDDWGNRFTVTISGNRMKWTNSDMKKYNCEYIFVKQ